MLTGLKQTGSVLTEVERSIRRYLIDLVKLGDPEHTLITYDDLAKGFGLPYGNRDEKGLLWRMLDNICIYEDERGWPLLSVIVVNKDYRIPGPGFFTFARNRGKQGPKEANDEFLKEERKRLFTRWKNDDAPDA